jgi:hypothetical protein
MLFYKNLIGLFCYGYDNPIMSANLVLSKSYKTFPWTKHIHLLLKEISPHLLEQESVITAFNALITCLLKYREQFQTLKPSPSSKYEICINVKYIDVMYSTGYIYTQKELRGLPHRIRGVTQAQQQVISSDIYQHYSVLYELIKRELVPAMERKAHAIRAEQYMKYASKRIAQYDEQIKKIQKRCEKDIEAIQNSIASLSIHIKESQEPCVVTTFPPESL